MGMAIVHTSLEPETSQDFVAPLTVQVMDDGQRTVRYFNTVCLASPAGKIVPGRWDARSWEC